MGSDAACTDSHQLKNGGELTVNKLMRSMLQFCKDEKLVETNKDTYADLHWHYGLPLMKEEKIPQSSVTQW